MARPVKRRQVCRLPGNNRFGPMNRRGRKPQTVVMSVDEYEAIRLIDWEGFTQEECAEQMQVARTTVQGIYVEARKKLSDVLVNNKELLIEGGEYTLCEDPEKGCGRGCLHRRQRRRQKDAASEG